MPAKRGYKPAKGKRQRNAHLIGFMAYETHDADILAWWDNLEYGQGSAILRALIRTNALNTAQVDITSVLLEVAALRATVEQMCRQMEDMDRKLLSGVALAQPGQSKLDADEAEKRQRNISRMKW